MEITKKKIEEIGDEFKRSGKADRIHFFKGIDGFGLRLQGDRRTWIVQYRIGLKQRRVTLGTTDELDPKEAIKRAKEVVAGVWKNEDPQQERKDERANPKITFRTVVDRYLELQKPKLRAHSFYENERARTTLSSLFTWAMKHGLCEADANPVAIRRASSFAEQMPPTSSPPITTTGS
jgi:hypothetical protein